MHSNCRRQIVFAKFVLRVFYHSLHERNVCHHKQASIDLIRQVIDKFDRNRAMSNTCLQNEVAIFNYAILIMITNAISNETILCDDSPNWVNRKIKKSDK